VNYDDDKNNNKKEATGVSDRFHGNMSVTGTGKILVVDLSYRMQQKTQITF
jgi:hypothetical protein